MIRRMSSRRGIRRAPSGRGSPGTGSGNRADPAPPRGGTARENAGTSRQRSPSSVPSFRFQWVSSAGPWSVWPSGIAPSVRAQPCGIHRETVVVAGDLDDAGPEVLHGLVHTSMPEPHLERPAAERQREQLMAQADPEDRHLADQPADRRDAVGGDRRIARPVRQEDPVEPARGDLGRRGLRREHRRLAPHHAQGVAGCSASCRSRRPPPGSTAPCDSSAGPTDAAASYGSAADTVLARSAPSIAGRRLHAGDQRRRRPGRAWRSPRASHRGRAAAA